MIQYLTENEMLWMLRDYCASWDLENKWYHNTIKIEREWKAIHKYNESKWKRVLQSKYLKAKCGSNHCYLEEDFEMFLSDYLNN